MLSVIMMTVPHSKEFEYIDYPKCKITNKQIWQSGADWTYRPTALRAVGPWLKFIMFSSAYLPCLEIIFESSQKDPYILDFL